MSYSIQNVYEKHHRSSRQEGFSILEKERGSLLANLIGRGHRVLDIGCRDGALTKYFSEDNVVIGVDIDRKALCKIKESLGINTISFDLNGDWSDLSGKTFDRIVAGEVLEHLYYPEEIVKKVNSLLEPGGVFVGSVPNAFSLKNRIRYLLGRKKHTPLSDPTHINQFSYAELKSLLGRQFSNVEIIGLGRYGRLSKKFPNAIAFDLFFKATK